MPKWVITVKNSWPGKFLTKTIERYFLHGVAREAASLAYYLLFMLFPLMIFLSSLLGLLEFDISSVSKSLNALLPAGVVDMVENYLSYVSETSSRKMLWFGLIFTIYFPMRAADCLMLSVRRAYHLPRPKSPGHQFLYTIKVLLYTVFLLVTIALTLALATVGRAVLEFVGRFMVVPEAFIDLWTNLRFLVLGGVMFAAVGLLYAAAQDSRQPARNVVPGALAALVGWMVVSAAFSFYVENFASYSVIYGALGTVIVLMMWLNLTAMVLIMGAEINGVLASLRGRRTLKAKDIRIERKAMAERASQKTAPPPERAQHEDYDYRLRQGGLHPGPAAERREP